MPASFPFAPDQAPTVGQVFVDMFRHPYDRLVRQWNWKSAFLSALFRGGLFFSVNLTAGWRAAVGAMLAEFALRGLLTGFYGALTQRFRLAEPAWQAALTVMVMLPVIGHSVELLVHWLRGTPNLFASIAASACFTALSTLFHLYAMRRGALCVGEGQKPLMQDFREMPRVVAGFLVLGPAALWKAVSARRRRQWIAETD